MTNAIVVSPCELYRRAWKSLLESLVYVKFVRTAANVAEITMLTNGGDTMSILVDAPGSERRMALQLGPLCGWCRALFVVNDYEPRTILPLLRLGVTGFTARGDSIANFAKAFKATTENQIGLPSDVADRAMTELADGREHHPNRPNGLTLRESEVLQMLADGMSNRDIAQRLFLSVRTVEAHLRSLYGKLEVKSRTEAALWAVRHGYAPLI